MPDPAHIFLRALLGEVPLHEVQVIMELNLVNRPDMDAFIAPYAARVAVTAARKVFLKQVATYLSNSEKDAREATADDMGDGPVPEWILRCQEQRHRVDFFQPGEDTPEFLELVVEYLNEHPDEATAPYAFKDMLDKALVHHLHPAAKVQRDFHDVWKRKQPDGTVVYTLAPVTSWVALRADRDARRADRLDARRHAGERVNPDGPACVVKLVVQDRQIIDMTGYVLNPSNSTELRDAFNFVVYRENLDVTANTLEVAKLSNGHTVVALLSNGARDYVSIMLKNCIGLNRQTGYYDSGCTTYAILAPDGVPLVAISFRNGRVDEALGMGNGVIQGTGDYRDDLLQEFKATAGALFNVVACVGGYQRREDGLRSGDIVIASVNLARSLITSLPDHLEVRGALSVSGTSLTELPQGLRVRGILNIRATRITEIPEDTEAADLLADRASIDYGSVCRWMARTSADKVRDRFVSKHCQIHYPDLNTEERAAKFDAEVLPTIKQHVEGVDLDAPCPPERPDHGRPTTVDYFYWKWLHKVFTL